MTEIPGSIRRASPLIGEHGLGILMELRYGEADIRRRMDKNVISVEKPL
jgi:hypothetical protein